MTPAAVFSFLTFVFAVIVGLGGVVLMHHCRRFEVSLRSAYAWTLMVVSGVMADQAARDHGTVGTVIITGAIAAPTLYVLLMPAELRSKLVNLFDHRHGCGGTR